jgi:hypothetical protein
MNLYVEYRNVRILSHLTSYYDVCGQELYQVLVIQDDLRLVGLSLEIYSLMSKCFDDYKEFLVMDLIVAFG